MMICLALVGSAFISAAESALLSARPSLIEHLAEDGNRRAKVVQAVLSRYENFFATILLFGNLFNIIVAVAAGNVVVDAITDGEATIMTNILATALATILVYTIGELTPKTIGAHRPELLSLAVAHVIFALMIVARPFVAVFTVLPIAVLRIFGVTGQGQGPVYTTGELSLIIDRSQEHGVLDETHGEMIDNLLNFGEKDLTYHEVRIHTSEIIWLDADDALQAFFRQYQEHVSKERRAHEQLPGFVVRQGEQRPSGYWYGVDQLAGVIYAKDVLATVANGGIDADTPIRKVMVDRPLHMPDTTKLDDVLKEMIRSGHEIVVSINDRQEVNGIVTLKGILELMRGDEDTLAVEDNAIQNPDANTFIVPGGLSVERTRLETGLEIPLNPRYETIAGFFIDELQQAPEMRSTATHNDSLEMTVVEMDGNRIQRLRIRRLSPEGAPAL